MQDGFVLPLVGQRGVSVDALESGFYGTLAIFPDPAF